MLNLRRNGRLHRGDDEIKVGKGFLDGERVHVPAQPLAGSQRGFQIVTGNLDREGICDSPACAILVFHPRRVRQRHPDRSSIDQKLDVDGIGMPRGNRNDHRLIHAVNWLPGPPVGGGEILKHG